MTQPLVLSLFPGIGLLDMAFEEAGFCVVRGPDVLWGGDIRRFHPPAGRFDGVIGGPPCQAFSVANNHQPAEKRINLIPEFERCVREAEPQWFLMENVRNAPIPCVNGYAVADYLVKNRWFGAVQVRLRRFSFGWRGDRKLLLIQPEVWRAKQKRRAVLASDGKRGGWGNTYQRLKNLPNRRLTLGDACELQGLPRDYLPKNVFCVEGAWRLIGNGVPLPMGRAIAKAVLEAISQ